MLPSLLRTAAAAVLEKAQYLRALRKKHVKERRELKIRQAREWRQANYHFDLAITTYNEFFGPGETDNVEHLSIYPRRCSTGHHSEETHLSG